MSKLKKNYIYNVVYQVLNIVLPLLTIPILSRALGPEASGVYSYTYSIVGYFMIFGMLGISNYGNRKIAKSRGSISGLRRSFFTIYSVQVFFNILAIIAYIIYVQAFAQYKTISLIEVFFLFSNMLDIGWFYFGMEEFKKPVVRNIIIKILTLIMIIIFIRAPEDLTKYTIIMSVGTVLSQSVLWLGLNKYISLSYLLPKRKDVFRDMRGILILFIPVISYSIYKMMDIIMLGIQSDMTEVGYYQYAEKIIGVPLGFIAALGTVMLPRLSNLIANKNISLAKKYIEKSLKFIMFFTIPCVFGLIAISNEFSTVFLGAEYERTGTILIFLSVTLIFTAWATVIRTQWLIPTEKDGAYVFTTIFGAIVNFVINIILIPIIGGVGAAIGTIISEFIIMFSQSAFARKELNFRNIIKPILSFFIKGAVMFIVIELLGWVIGGSMIVGLFLKIILGVSIYTLLNMNYIKNDIGNPLEFLKKLKAR